jgi:serine/threonine protein kinase
LAVLGFVFTDKIVCQHLTDLIWIGFDSVLNERHTVRVARILHALGRNLRKLKEYYQRLSSSQLNLTNDIRVSRHFFPSVNTYYDSKQDTNVEFDYIRPLETDPACITFLARTRSETDSRFIVVKFVERYGEPVHRLLAEHDFAPQLFYFGRVSESGTPSYRSLRMVVMEYLQGSTVAQLLADPSRNHSTHILDLELIAGLERIIKFLHSHNYVYGDLRGPNIMITLEKNIKLIDFDWAGKVGHVKYPNFLSPKIGWPPGAEGGKPITAQHDLEMIPNVINPR